MGDFFLPFSFFFLLEDVDRSLELFFFFLSLGELCLDGLGVAFFCFPLLDPAGLVDNALPGDLDPEFFRPGWPE